MIISHTWKIINHDIQCSVTSWPDFRSMSQRQYEAKKSYNSKASRLHYWVRQALTFTMLCDSVVNRDVCLFSKLTFLLNFNKLHLLKYISTMAFFFQCHYCKCHVFICHLFLFLHATVQKSILWRLQMSNNNNQTVTTVLKVLTDVSVMAK